MKFVAFFGASLFAFVFFTVASHEPAQAPIPAPVPAQTPPPVPAAAAPQEPPKSPAGTPLPPAPPATTKKKKKTNYNIYSRAYTGPREDEPQETAEEK